MSIGKDGGNIGLLETVFRKKTEFLVRGFVIGKQFIDSLGRFGLKFEGGRKGGAGPAGGRYFIFDNGSVANIPLWIGKEYSPWILEKAIRRDPTNPEMIYCETINTETREKFDALRLIPVPIKYNIIEHFPGIPNKKIALIHGIDCLATTVIQRCIHWRRGEKCRFCSIEISLLSGATVEKKTPEMLVEVLGDALKFGVKHVTLTTGTTADPEENAEYYIKIARELAKRYPEVPLHVQLEPFKNTELLNRMREAGIDTVGVHAEFYDEKIRKKYCPGKARIPLSDYLKFWKECVSVFGRGNVSTYQLMIDEEPIDTIVDMNREVIRIGVIPFIVPVRYQPGNDLLGRSKSPREIIDICIKAADDMIKFNTNPLDNRAGCVRCGGCSPITDAYRYISALKKKKSN